MQSDPDDERVDVFTVIYVLLFVQIDEVAQFLYEGGKLLSFRGIMQDVVGPGFFDVNVVGGPKHAGMLFRVQRSPGYDPLDLADELGREINVFFIENILHRLVIVHDHYLVLCLGRDVFPDHVLCDDF